MWLNSHKVLDGNTGVWRNISLCEGSADLVGVVQGRYVEVEVKTPKGRQEESQRRHQAVIERMGGIYIVAKSAAAAEEAIQGALCTP